MTAREYAKERGIEVIGKLEKKLQKIEKFDYFKGEMVIEKFIYWVDEAGNEFSKHNGVLCIVDAEGTVY